MKEIVPIKATPFLEKPSVTLAEIKGKILSHIIYKKSPTSEPSETAFLAVDMESRELCVMKLFPTKQKKEWQTMVRILEHMKDSSVCMEIRKSEYVLMPGEEGYIVIWKYLTGQSLKEYVDNSKSTFTNDQIQAITRNVIYGLSEIHKLGYSYNNLTPDNIILHGKTSGRENVVEITMR